MNRGKLVVYTGKSRFLMNEKNITCDQVDDFFTDYAEGTLEPCNMVACDSHFETCQACRDNLVIIKGIVSALSSIEEDDLPVGFAENAADAAFATHQEPAGSVWQRLSGLWRPAMVTVSIMAVLVVGFFGVYEMSGPDTHADVAVSSEDDFRLLDSCTLSSGVAIIDDLKVDVTLGAVAVSSGQSVELARGCSSSALSLSDGSKVVLTHRAAIVLKDDGIVLEKGRLNLTMAPTGLGFIVTTPHADVVVRGTVYSVEVGTATRVMVESGSVAVESRISHESVILKGGDKVSVLPSGKLQKIMSGNVNSFDLPSVEPAGEAENTAIGISDSN